MPVRFCRLRDYFPAAPNSPLALDQLQTIYLDFAETSDLQAYINKTDFAAFHREVLVPLNEIGVALFTKETANSDPSTRERVWRRGQIAAYITLLAPLFIAVDNSAFGDGTRFPTPPVKCLEFIINMMEKYGFAGDNDELMKCYGLDVVGGVYGVALRLQYWQESRWPEISGSHRPTNADGKFECAVEEIRYDARRRQ